jgi:TetR/AcrR family transcriptional regulator, transcriptional repressor for nem operon
VRYGKERKRETRRRIIQTAGYGFKRDGIDSSGIATLMSDAGLTNGAFYVHFASKEDLVATTVADQLRAQPRVSARWRPATPELSNTCVYLTVQHRDNPDDGCPSAALLGEIERCTDATKQAYTDGVLVNRR